ncbi:MAG: threonine-phosphate decarboxylase [Dethiobacter sp.]|nr:threonine-phosphate decarboxylase [Dethiobacter sp.]
MRNVRSKLHPFGHGGDLQTAAEQAGLTAEELLDFSASINPLGPPAGLYDFLRAQLPKLTAYPDPACRKLVSAISSRYQLKHSLVVGNGAGELIYLVMRSLPAGKVLIPVPTFALYEQGAQAASRKASYYFLQECDNFELNVPAFCDAVSRVRPALTVLCNPNNPTGTLLSREEILTVAATCAEHGGYLLLDEAFLEFCPDWPYRSMLVNTPPNVLVLCSMTKMYAIPGLRLGFLAAPAEIADATKQLHDPWSVNTLAQLAGEYVLGNHDFIRYTAEQVSRLAQKLACQLNSFSQLRVWPPTVNYLFLEVLAMPSFMLQQQLLAEKILVRDCGNFHGLSPRYIRVAVRTEAENEALVAALKRIFGLAEGK